MFNSPSTILRRTLAFSTLFAAGTLSAGAMHAQQVPNATVQPSTSFQMPVGDAPSSSLFSSSDTETGDAGNANNVASLVPTAPNFAAMMQYGGGQRSRYGRPRYRGKNTNPDGSNKYTFYAGAGLSQPVGNTYHYFNPSWAIQVGAGRQFSKKFALPVEFNWNHFGINKNTLDNQFVVENSLYVYDGQLGSIDGSGHVWSFSVDPTYTFYSSEGVGAYLVAGVGFYHKVTDFTTPVTVAGYDYYGYPIAYTANQEIDHYTSNAPGFSGGLGLTYKFSRFSNERFYAEARYVFVDNSQRTGFTINTYQRASATSTDYFPANSNRTGYVPITVGIRF